MDDGGLNKWSKTLQIMMQKRKVLGLNILYTEEVWQEYSYQPKIHILCQNHKLAFYWDVTETANI